MMFRRGVDTRLAMGLRSSAYCCQAVTELVAKIVSKKGHMLVYLDDFGGAELGDKAFTTFAYLGSLLKHFGLRHFSVSESEVTIFG